jgi:hypothetical protein
MWWVSVTALIALTAHCCHRPSSSRVGIIIDIYIANIIEPISIDSQV